MPLKHTAPHSPRLGLTEHQVHVPHHTPAIPRTRRLRKNPSALGRPLNRGKEGAVQGHVQRMRVIQALLANVTTRPVLPTAAARHATSAVCRAAALAVHWLVRRRRRARTIADPAGVDAHEQELPAL